MSIVTHNLTGPKLTTTAISSLCPDTEFVTRKARVSFFHEFMHPPKRYLIDRRGDLVCFHYADYFHPATFVFGPESCLVLEVSRSDLSEIIRVIEERILRDGVNAQKLHSMSFWEEFVTGFFKKEEEVIDLSSKFLRIRRIDGFWQLVIPQSLGFYSWKIGYSFSEDAWEKLKNVLMEILSLTAHLAVVSDQA
jgi:hypothetical protein